MNVVPRLCVATWFAAAAAGAGDPPPPSTVSREPAATRSWQPLLDKPLADPYVFEDEGYYYLTGTALYGYCGTDLTSEALKPFDLTVDFGELGGPYQLWGFKYYRHTDGVYHAYATVHFGNFITAVAHLSPQSGQTWRPGKPITAWRINRLLVGDPDGASGLAYDQVPVEDEDGRLYLVYDFSEGRHRDVHIMAHRMVGPGTLDPDFKPRRILSPEGFRSEDRNPGYIQIVEATHIARVQGKYVLVYSVGDFALYDGRSNYKLGVAFSDTLLPPPGRTYTKVMVPDPANLWGTHDRDGMEICYLLQSQHPRWHNYCAEHVVGPGLGTIVRRDDGHTLVFHGYPPGHDAKHRRARHTWAMPITVDIRPDRPMPEWIVPHLPGISSPWKGDR